MFDWQVRRRSFTAHCDLRCFIRLHVLDSVCTCRFKYTAAFSQYRFVFVHYHDMRRFAFWEMNPNVLKTRTSICQWDQKNTCFHVDFLTLQQICVVFLMLQKDWWRLWRRCVSALVSLFHMRLQGIEWIIQRLRSGQLCKAAGGSGMLRFIVTDQIWSEFSYRCFHPKRLTNERIHSYRIKLVYIYTLFFFLTVII